MPLLVFIMKKIIKHIRNEWYRYIFDTIVVIVGILIAFTLNNWNEKRNKLNLIEAYATSLITDLQADIAEVKIIKSQMEESIVRIDSLANYTRTKKINELSNLSLVPFTMGDYMYRPYSWNKATIEDLKISGVLRYKGNENLSEQIVSYDALTKHLEEDYSSDMALMANISILAGNIVNLNYSNYEELTFYGNTNNSILKYEFSSSDAYRRAEKEDLKLLTGDINKIHELVNGKLKLRAFLKIRVNTELPRLINKAENIIELLQTN